MTYSLGGSGGFGPPSGAGKPARKPPGPRWQQALVATVGFVAVLYVVELLDVLTAYPFALSGIAPRSMDGLSGVLFAPLIHADWAHLMANSVPLLVLGFLVFLSSLTRAVMATAIIWVVGGMGTWLTGGDNTVHIGASIIVFGWLAFLITQGLFTRSGMQLLVGGVVLFFYGTLLWGVLPGQAGVSWQGHLFGALGGVVAAWILSNDERARRRASRQQLPPHGGMYT
ncbi:rhomboid family intramembrane serine protease [Hoyosella sp. YIM 151337]|uniref:rhomboid family intramembrane serine protease n=1 Tax=Hoyosella sp. YIM 151337 TaxID=2992742 RepID=UPI002236467B|nr:rhomboid family intramembrane serine protease [Hoyosella sp. YIM 151337]MCW4352135.1 rhomboid family intramembrane serine protease [Hoyosella sp. YIM 151337]